MAQTPHPTWYDVLGIPPDATPGQVKAAWRESTDKFEPGSGSGQFRMFNEAADVLLDPVRRAAYDASLAAERRGAASPRSASETGAAATTGPPTHTDLQGRSRRARQERRSSVSAGSARRGGGEPVAVSASDYASRLGVLLTTLLAVLTVAAVISAVLLGLKVRTDARVSDARDEAPSAAEAAAKALLSYDYRRLPADQKRASVYLTPSFRPKYLKNIAALEKQKDGTPGLAVQTKTVVTASVLGSGVVDAEDGVVRVLVYVDQTSKKPGADPQIFQNRVAMTMEKDGSRWLVDDLKSY